MDRPGRAQGLRPVSERPLGNPHDSPAVAEGLRRHFGKELNKAQSRGFTIYNDSAPEFEKVCKKLSLLHRPATPNSEEANARHER